MMNLEKKSAGKAVALACVLACSVPAYAISIGTYSLGNHSDGSESPPAYGLRLDGLLTGASNEEYTFDFDHALSNMTLTYDGTTVVIDGAAYGGEDIGSGYQVGTTAVWDIHFEYIIGVSQPGDGGLDDVRVDTDYNNFGSLSSSLGTFELADKADGSNMSFRFGDESGSGHRGEPGISGWGWLRHGTDCVNESDCVNVQYSDWLFTASPVPVPAAAWLFGSALIGLVAVKRK
ncbi:VPLPA-CTERM sorting domain-containing protein [Oceanicoccus sp. KOV_DT_Chl]|uniref:VPLPA-CTERM sorting domain-containing protein n=1 Tax=Oceanicoccus sp. KOV_DT_Chl TaxID=1904639 RepID=UPI00190ECCE1|nr:VPLPA-CTERM sorting domain-containing protein [Oceanicoccus sp. KOV_DT_Chl]